MTRILVVDDHPENIYLLRALLEGHGYAVDEARHGAEALTRARQRPPDVVISDLLMPVLDGYTLLRHWRADDRLAGIPFMVYTATYTEPRDERLAMVLGADVFMVKPAEPDAIVACIRDLLERKRRGEIPSATGHAPDEHVVLKDYNEVLVAKLEKKALEAEQTNRELRDEIGERKRAEARLRDSEERFRTTFEQAPVGLAHVDSDGTFIWVNNKLCELTGYGRDELRHLTFMELTVPEDRAESDEARRAMLAGTQTTYAAEKQYLRKDGRQFWGSVHTTILRAQPTESHSFMSVIVDISDRRMLEDQLRQSQKMEAVGRLAGGVAHDFNNLLTIISGYSDLLLDLPGIGPADREAVTAIREASERAAALTRQLLGFSRKTMLQPSVLELNAVVTDIEKMLGRLIGEDVRLTTVLAPNLGLVRVDPGQLDQVLMNLAVNARDAMPQGGQLTIETANVVLTDEYAALHLDSKPGPHVMLAMTDTGCGMTPEIQRHIFEPFFTTKEVDKGTGLGLSVVFGIVQQSGGWIHVYSEPDCGTTFKIYFPVVSLLPVTRKESRQQSDLRGGETILLVEDEAGVRALAARSLQTYGYQVIAATDGKDALRILRNHVGPLDLVLTDVVMPHLSGPELAKALHAQFPHLKVLFMSGYTDDAVVRHGLLEADVTFIQKPYTPTGLVQKVRHVLDGTGP